MAKKLTNDDLISIIDREISQSSTYSTKIAEQRAKALRYYNREPFGKEKKGRSAYVSSEVQEVISWCLPQILKVFHGDDVVQFDPTGPGTELSAELATEYCKYVMYKKNDGFLTIHDFCHDALLQKNGIVKIYYDKTPTYKREEYKNLTTLELTQLLQDPNVEPIEHDNSVELIPNQQTGVPEPTHNVTIKRKQVKPGCTKVLNVPPEEIVVSSRAKSLNLDKAPFVAHTVKQTISYLRQQGYDIPDDIQDSTESNTEYAPEKIVRDAQTGLYQSGTDETPTDPSQREVWVTEAYFKCDYDGDGIAECRKVTKIGSKVIDNEEVYAQPFVSTSPFPQPHQNTGRSMADEVMDLQLLKSMVMRSGLDSQSFNINPQKAVDITKLVDPNDLLDTNPGNYIKMRGDINNAFYAMPSTGVGAEAFQLLEYIDMTAESRSGVSRMTQGIDGNVFNKTATGTAAIMSASQEKIALIIRLIAETGIGPIYKKIIQLASRYAEGPELIRINGQFAEVDPRQWTDLDSITVCVGTGALDKAQDLANVNQLMSVQQQMLGAGPQFASMVDPDKVHNTLQRLVKGMGFKNPDEFFNNPKGQAYQELAQQAQQQTPPPDPNLIMAEAQMELSKVKGAQVQADTQKTQQEMYLKQAELDLKRSVEAEKADLARQKLQLDSEIRTAEINNASYIERIQHLEALLNDLNQQSFEAPGNLPGQTAMLPNQ
jgi:hypothetical protein